MAGNEFHFDTRIRRYHVPLATQQHRLHHLRSIAARNVVVNNKNNMESGLFFTLHLKPDSNTFYTSEIIFDSVNPTWKNFEICNFSDNVNTSSSYVTVKLWTAGITNQLIVEWLIFFSGLSYFGEQIPKEGKNFKANTVIFGMTEGYYGCNDSLQHPLCDSSIAINDAISVDSSSVRTSYTLSTLCRVKTIERAIKQTQAAARRRRMNIKNKLQGAEELHLINAEKELLLIKISILQSEVYTQQRNLQVLQKEASCNQQEINRQWNELKEKYEELKRQKEKLANIWRNFCELRETLLKTEAQLTFRRKELITDLLWIYPIVEFPDKSGFSIHNVHLPDSEHLVGHDETMISVALGYVCHVLLMMSQFLNVPLRYSIRYCGSKSSIKDHISSTIPVKSREFPLYSKGKDRRLFEYGVYLLNKNIAQLRILHGLLTKELKDTLPNLSSLIELRLSVNSDSYGTNRVLVSTINPAPSVESNLSSLSNKIQQNGLTHISSSVDNIHTHLKQSSASEMDHLKQEMEEMMPTISTQNNSIEICKLNDVSGNLSCSLDKGLNDLEKSLIDVKAVNQQKPEKLRSHFKKFGQSYHHSSYPNLNSKFSSINCDNLTLPCNISDTESTPLKMWVASSSHTNSEDENLQEESKIDENKESLLSSCFYISSAEWSTPKTESSFGHTTEYNHIKETLLQDQDFEDDLTLRTEHLANRSSSFQMQKNNALNISEK